MGSLLFSTPLPPVPGSPSYSVLLKPQILHGRLNNDVVEFWIQRGHESRYLGKARLHDFCLAPINYVLNAILHVWFNVTEALLPSLPHTDYLHTLFLTSHLHDLRDLMLMHNWLQSFMQQLARTFFISMRYTDLTSCNPTSTLLP